ncbi:MAG TPA: hypothetical protein VF184_12840, partial [Phycisphaeraceae bacterium]
MRSTMNSRGLAAALGILLGWVRLTSAAAPPGYVDASAFGYDAADATAALQAAIDTGSNVYVPNMGAD